MGGGLLIVGAPLGEGVEQRETFAALDGKTSGRKLAVRAHGREKKPTCRLDLLASGSRDSPTPNVLVLRDVHGSDRQSFRPLLDHSIVAGSWSFRIFGEKGKHRGGQGKEKGREKGN